MNVAILYDAGAIAGDPGLFARSKRSWSTRSAASRRGWPISRAPSICPRRQSASSPHTRSPTGAATRSTSRRAAFFPSCMACAPGRSNTASRRPHRRAHRPPPEEGALGRELRASYAGLFCLMTLKLDAKLGASANGARAARPAHRHGPRPAARRAAHRQAVQGPDAAPLQSRDVLDARSGILR